MTNDEIIQALNELTKDDPEESHGKADELLLMALRHNNLGDIALAWEAAHERIMFWYS